MITDVVKKPVILKEKELTPFEGKVLDSTEEYISFLFKDSNFSNTQSRSLSFDKSLFRKVLLQFSELNLLRVYDCQFINCDLSNTACTKAGMQRVEFEETKLTGFKLIETDVKDTVFKDCKLDYFQSMSSKYTRVVFKNCDLRYADFSGADLTGITFSGCDLTEVEFSRAKLQNTDIRGCIIDNIKVSIQELEGAIVDASQAVTIAQLLGMKVM